MKFKPLILFLAVPFLAAMGSTPREDGAVPYVRPTAPAEPVPAPGTPMAPEELHILSADEARPDEFLWQARPLVIFADTAADPSFIEQLAAINRDPRALLARDVVVITDSDPQAGSIWRRQLRPEGFSLVLLDKDGQVKQRKPAPRSVREITRAIDKFPLRRQEIDRNRAMP